ncbi:MAG: V-type ATP synthase subunit E [Lachnospiraceae bacterium]|nr:V-type ATP synthase subunit E [Robinsoniella sp.]MDY3765948.1 V-type ATP synthase subunit E [Lachnospiraceae bacterium]
MTTEEKLKHFEESSISKAKSLASDMIRDHQKALDQIFCEHKKEKDRQIALQIQTETESLRRANNMTLSREQLKMKRICTQKNEELKEQIFSEVLEKLKNYRKTEDYTSLLQQQIDKIHEVAGNQEVKIYFDPEDAPLVESLHAEGHSSFLIADDTFLGGTKAMIPSRHILIDHSFQTKLEEAKKDFTFHGGMTHE